MWSNSKDISWAMKHYDEENAKVFCGSQVWYNKKCFWLYSIEAQCSMSIILQGANYRVTLEVKLAVLVKMYVLINT